MAHDGLAQHRDPAGLRDRAARVLVALHVRMNEFSLGRVPATRTFYTSHKLRRQSSQRKPKSSPLPFRSQDAGRRPEPMNGSFAVARLFSKSVSAALSVAATGQASLCCLAKEQASTQ